MTQPTLVLHLGDKPSGADMTHRDFAQAHELAIVDNADLTYYVAQEATDDPLVYGKVAGSVQINAADRKISAALVGNWIASGYVVNRMNHKQLTATVRKLQKSDTAETESAASAVMEAAAHDGNQPAIPEA